jgi:hypothetical protein
MGVNSRLVLQRRIELCWPSSYAISRVPWSTGDPTQAPRPADRADDDLTSVLDNFHAHQMLHVTLGSVLTARDAARDYVCRDRFFATLRSDEEVCHEVAEAHFDKHLAPFPQEGVSL